MTPAPDVLAHPCPRCPAGIRESCFVARTGRELPKPHTDRVKLAQRVEREARQRADGDATKRIESPRFRKVYAAARLELELRNDWTPLAAEQLESLVLNMEAAEDARGKAKAKPTVDGSMGQPVANPLIAVALRYDAQALANARALKLTPDTRGARAGIPGADNPAPDDDEDKPPADPLDELDELADRRKAKAAKGK